MMFHRLGLILINKNQKGFTLIEILIALAITALIIGSITGAISHVIIGSARSTNHMTAVREVQDAGYWVSRDAQMAQDVTITPTEPTGFPLTLYISEDIEPPDIDYTVSYSLDGDKLKRQKNGSPETLIAEYIDPTETKCEFTALGDEYVLILTITANVFAEIETRTYEVIPRLGS